MEHGEVYARLKTRLGAERVWIEERKKVLDNQLAQLTREAEAAEALATIRDRFRASINNLTDIEWRELFVELHMRIHIGDHSQNLEWIDNHAYQNASRPGVMITFGLELRPKRIGDIVSNVPW